MEKQGGGAIVNISSIAAIRYTGIPSVGYHANKAAILQLTQSVAIQYAKKNIRANAILPGFMKTPMIIEPRKDFYAEGDIEKMFKMRDEQCPTKKMGDAWDVAPKQMAVDSLELKHVRPDPITSIWDL